jgi:uncharacterized protein YdeI (YjbR/CyaY-like superfamily)
MPKMLQPKTQKLTKEELCDFENNVALIKSEADKTVDPDFLHPMPEDLQDLLDSNPDVKAKWDTLTPLTKNEWICWVTIVKQQKTREEHLVRLCEDLRGGKRRPCCWPGCPHRRKSAGKWFK